MQVSALGNWWGHPTGPYHVVSNLGGQGNKVSNGVVFDPWLTSPNKYITIYSLDGQVKDNKNNSIPGVTILTNARWSTTTDISGSYTIKLITGTYIITPVNSSYTFTPISRTVSIPPNQTGINFTGMSATLDTYEPDDLSTYAKTIDNGLLQTHSIFPATDEDWAKFSLSSESEVIIQTSGTNSDTRMWLYNASLRQLEYNSNGGTGSFSKIDRLCNVNALPAGTYYIKIDETGNNDTIASYNLSFITTICSKPILQVSPPSIVFNAVTGGSNPPAKSFIISNLGTGILNWSASENMSWLSLSSISGTAPSTINATANINGLSTGTYNGQIMVSSSGSQNSPQPLTVTLVITTSTPPILQVSPPSIVFNAIAGGSNPPTKSFIISNLGTGILDWSASENMSWLSLSSISGTAPSTINATANINGLSTGVYTGQVTINSNGGGNQNSLQIVDVMLAVNKLQEIPLLQVLPLTLTFTASEGGSNPAPQSFTINNSGLGTLSWSASEGATWLSIEQDSGTAPTTLNALVNINDLRLGTYGSKIVIRGSGATNSPQEITVILKVTQSTNLLLSSVTPNSIGDKGEVTIKMSGAGFTTGMQVELQQSGVPTLVADTITLVSSKNLLAHFNLTGGISGTYALSAIWPDSTQRNLTDAVEVIASIGPRLEAKILARDVYRTGRTYAGWIEYTNTGDADLPAPLFLLSTSSSAPLKTICDSNWATNNTVQLFGMYPETPTGALPPGETHYIPFFFKGANIATTFQLDILDSSTQAIDWATYKQTMKPTGMLANEWDAIWQTLIANLGNSWDSYLQTLRTNTEILQKRGQSVDCIRDLLTLEIQKAQGKPVAAVMGQLLNADTHIPLTGVPIIAYSQNSNVIRREETDLTNGSFVIDALSNGVYELFVEGYELVPTVTIEISKGLDITSQNLFVQPLPEDPIPEPPKMLYNSPQLVNVAGVPHLVFVRNGQIYHTIYTGAEWGDIAPIVGAEGQNPQLLYNPTLLDGNSPGLALFWRNGTGNNAKLMQATARPNNKGGWQWSVPITYSKSNVASDNYRAVVDTNSTPLVVWQMIDRNNVEDDTDLYYSNIAISSTTLSWPNMAAILITDQVAELDNGSILPVGTAVVLSKGGQAYIVETAALAPLGWSASVNYDFKFDKKGQVPKYIPYIGGKNSVTFNANIQGQANESSASAKGSLDGKIDLLQERITGNVNGNLSANWGLDKKTCQFVFKTATLSTSLGVDGKFPLLNFGIGTSYFSIAKVELGIQAGGQLTGNIIWVNQGGNSFEGAIEGTINLGVYGKVSVIGGLTEGSISGTGNFKAVIDKKGFRADDLYFQANAEAKFGWRTYQFEWRYPISSILTSNKSFGAMVTTLNQSLSPTVTVSIGSKLGTTNVYGTNSVLANVNTDLIDDGIPVLALASDGLIYAFWTRESSNPTISIGNTIVYATYNGVVWSSLQTVPNSLGFNRDLTVEIDNEGDLLLTWIRADATGLTITSNINTAMTAEKNTDIWYTELKSGVWSSPTGLTLLTGEEKWLSLNRESDGNLWATWVRVTVNGRTLHSSKWSGSSWTAPFEITTANIQDYPTLLDIGGITSLIWSQGIDDFDGDPNHSESATLYKSTLNSGVWSSPVELVLNETSLNQVSMAESKVVASGTSDLTFKLNLTPPKEVCIPDDPTNDEKKTKNAPLPSSENVNPVTSKDTRSVRSFDPNEKIGPTGIGTQRIISTTDTLHYLIYFENKSGVATAPAQEVFIIDQLDSNMDLSTIRFEEIAFGETVIAITDKSNGQMYTRQIITDYRIGVNKVWWVDINGQANQTTGEVKWTFRTLDPVTNDLPNDALAGFLPPNDSTKRGEGHVAFSIKLKNSTTLGTNIVNKASIIFDTNKPILTNEVSNIIGVPTESNKNTYLPLIVK